jgi:hypothetical protein
MFILSKWYFEKTFGFRQGLAGCGGRNWRTPKNKKNFLFLTVNQDQKAQTRIPKPKPFSCQCLSGMFSLISQNFNARA